MKVSEDRSPSALFQVHMPLGMHKYLTAVVVRLGRGFSVSAMLNQIIPKYLDTYARLQGKPELDELVGKALSRFEKVDPIGIDHRMPLALADQLRAIVSGTDDRDRFAAALDQVALLAAYDFRVNGPLKGREF